MRSHLQTVHALAVALKGAHFPALLGQVARDEPTHGMGLRPGLVSDLVQGGAFWPAQQSVDLRRFRALAKYRPVLRFRSAPRARTICFCLGLNGSPDPRDRGLAIREPSHRFYSGQAIPDLHQSLHRPFRSNVVKILLACEGDAARIRLCWPLFVDVIVGGEMK